MIPKVIHYCWFGGNPLPEEYQKYIESWKEFCPDYEIKQWNESNYDVTKNKYMYEAYQAKKWGFVPDYARLDIIYNYGGFYLDTDVEIIKNLDELRKEKAFVGFENPRYVNFGLGFGAEKGNKIIKNVMEWYENQSFIGDNGKPVLVPSPILNTRTLCEMGLTSDGKYQTLNAFGDCMTVLPTDYLCPMDYDIHEMNITERTYSIHHFSESWQTEEAVKSHMNQIKYARKYGKDLGLKIAKFVNIPLRMKFHLKDKGFFGTMKFAVNKIFGGGHTLNSRFSYPSLKWRMA